MAAIKVSTDPTKPNYQRPELTAVSKTLTLMDDLLAGPERMWDKSTSYIRKWKDESVDVYDIRRLCKPSFGGLRRTLGAASGLLFAKSLAVNWNGSEARLSPIWDNIDNGGTKGTVFAKRFAEMSIRDGLGILHVDYTKPPADELGQPIVVHGGNEQQFNLRPRWTRYARCCGINWYPADGDDQRLGQITLAEPKAIRKGEFGIGAAQRYRDIRLVLTPNGWQATWTLRELDESPGVAPDTFHTIDSGVYKNRNGVIADFLPIAIAYTGATDELMTAEVPLSGVGYANLSHWQYETNLKFNREVCGFEQFVITGELMPQKVGNEIVQGQIKIGPLVAIHLQQGGTAEWIGPSGKGLEQLAAGAKEELDAMNMQGLGFLVPEKAVTTTATEARIDSTAQLASLATAGIGVQDAINMGWEYTAWYEGIEKANAPTIAINTEFESTAMDAGVPNAFATLVKEGFPKRPVLETLQKRGWIPEDADLDELESDWETNADVNAAAATDLASINSAAGVGTPNNAGVAA